MSRAENRRAPVRQHTLRLSEEGTAELLADGVTLWASDTDPDLLEELGTDALRDRDLGDVLEYLVDIRQLSDDEANECLIESDDPDPDEDEDEDETDDEDVTQ